MKMEAEQASNDIEFIETTEEVEMSKLIDDTAKLDAVRDASTNEIEEKEETAANIEDDDKEKLEKANKTIVELSKNLKIKEAELAETKSCYRLYIEKSKSVIRSLQNDAVNRSEAEEK